MTADEIRARWAPFVEDAWEWRDIPETDKEAVEKARRIIHRAQPSVVFANELGRVGKVDDWLIGPLMGHRGYDIDLTIRNQEVADAVIAAPQDITYLLTENTRLRTALSLREDLYNAAVWVGYYESDRKRAEYRAAVRRAREIVDRMGEALAPQPDAQQDECNRYNWQRTAELETIVDLVKAMADLGYGTPEHRSAHYAVLKAIESDAPQPNNAIPTQSERNSDAIAVEKE